MAQTQLIASATTPAASEAAAFEASDEPFWVERVPQQLRTVAWLDRTSNALHAAAKSWDSPFSATKEDIADHLLTPDELVVLRSHRRVVGFVGATAPIRLGRTGLTARYIEGTIVHRALGGKGKFDRLMRNLSGRTDIEVLHTQSPCMAKALAARSHVVFPDLRAGVRLGDMLHEDIKGLLHRAGREPVFCPVTGIAQSYYGRCLYENWPIPGEDYDGSFQYLLGNNTSAVVVVGISGAAVARENLASAYLEGVA